jgi:hypothetical protein
MTKHNEEELRVLWQNQAIGTMRLSTEQLREKAEQFERQTRRRYLRDQISFGFVAIAFAYGVIELDGGLVRLGCGLLLMWALYGVYCLHRFGSALSFPVEASTDNCAAYHCLQLVRQRDIALSRPLGICLAAPGFLLFAIGSSLSARQLPWEGAIGLVGVFAFICLAVVIHGKILAGQWQREIDGLQAMRDQSN